MQKLSKSKTDVFSVTFSSNKPESAPPTALQAEQWTLERQQQNGVGVKVPTFKSGAFDRKKVRKPVDGAGGLRV